MKGLILLVCLLLVSCGATMQERSDELYSLAMVCNQREKVPVIKNGIVKIENGNPVMQTPIGSCDEEWGAWDEIEEKIVQRDINKAAKNGPKCPPRHVAWCNRWCMLDKPRERKWICVPNSAVRSALGQYY